MSVMRCIVTPCGPSSNGIWTDGGKVWGRGEGSGGQEGKKERQRKWVKAGGDVWDEKGSGRMQRTEKTGAGREETKRLNDW